MKFFTVRRVIRLLSIAVVDVDEDAAAGALWASNEIEYVRYMIKLLAFI